MPLGAFKAALMGTAGVSAGDVVLLSTQTASGASSISFTSGIDSTYGEYIFKCYNMNPATDNQYFNMTGSTDGGSSYGVTKTTTVFQVHHDEADSATGLGYQTSRDLAQSTAVQNMGHTIGNGGDESGVFEIHVFNPASTTYVKHFYARSNVYSYHDFSVEHHVAGYWNTTSAINAIQFAMGSGNMDGKIKMWGVK